MTEITHSNKELQLAHKLVKSTFHVSFYFWLTLISVLTAIFSARIYDTNLFLKETFGPALPQYITLALALPVGLVLWRYHVNRAERKEAAETLFGEIGKGDGTTAKIIALTKATYSKPFATLLRARAQITAIGMVGAFLLFQRLSLNATITGGIWFYVGMVIASLLAVVIISIFAQKSASKEINGLETPEELTRAEATKE